MTFQTHKTFVDLWNTNEEILHTKNNRFITWLNHWSHMDYFNYVFTTLVGSSLSSLLKKLLLIIYSPQCYPRCPCLSFISRKEIKVFDGVQTVQGPKDSLTPLKSIIWKKSWNVFIKNLNFFSTEERKTWTSWMKWGRVNYQQKFFLK